MLHFRPPERDSLRAVCDMAVAPDQRRLVTAPAITLAQLPFEPGAAARVIWEDDTPVGLIAMIDPRVPDPATDRDLDKAAAFLWRFMIDAGHQRKGYGRLALAEVERIAADWGFARVTLSVMDLPNSAQPFYGRHGYRATGRRLFGQELEMAKMLGA